MNKLIEDKVIKTEKVKWRAFKFLQKNTFKEMSPAQMKKLKASITNNDFVETFKVWENGSIYCLDGYHRCLALSELAGEGYQVPDEFTASFIQCKDKKDAAKKVLIYSSQYASITDEGLYEFSHDFNINFEDIKLEIDIPKLDLDRYEAGYVNDGEYNEDEDVVPVPPKEPTAKLGDLYLLGGRHRLLCGDATNAEDVARLMEGKRAELLFTSPPYADMRDYGGNDLSIGNMIRFIPTFYDYVEYLVINLGIKRKNHEIDMYWDAYIDCAKKAGYKFLSWNVWNRMRTGSIASQTSMFSIYHEWIFVFGKNIKKLNRTIPNSPESVKRRQYKRGRPHRQADGTLKEAEWGNYYSCHQLGTVSDIFPLMARNVDSTHPAMFPVELPKEYIRAMTNDNDLVVDSFGGSGTTLIACEQTNRTCYMMEIEPLYIDVIIERYKNLTGKDVELIGTAEG